MQLRGEVTFPAPGPDRPTFADNNRQPAPDRIGGSEDQKNDPARAPDFVRALVQGPAGAAQPPHEESGESPATIDPPILAALIAVASPAASQTPDRKTARAIPPPPDGTPIAMTSPSGMDPEAAAQSRDAEMPGASPVPNSANWTDHSTRPSAPRPDLAANPSGKWTVRVAFAPADTAAPASVARDAGSSAGVCETQARATPGGQSPSDFDRYAGEPACAARFRRAGLSIPWRALSATSSPP